MFKKSKFIYKANAALAQLGINPLRIDNDIRRGTLEQYYERGRTPQEAACFLFTELGIGNRPIGAEEKIYAWEDKGLVDREWRKSLARFQIEDMKKE